MPVRTSQSTWEGDITSGHGKMNVGSGAWSAPYSVGTRMQNDPGTNPEELIGAAHSGCFSMALSAGLTKAGFKPRSIETTAQVRFDQVGEGWKITGVHLRTLGNVPDIDEATFQTHAETAKNNCPVSKVLASTEITLEATLAK